MTRKLFLTRLARVAVTAGLAALVQIPGVAGGSQYFSFFALQSTNVAHSGGSSRDVSDPFGSFGRGFSLSGPHFSFGSGGGARSGLSEFSKQIGSSSNGGLDQFTSTLHTSSTFSLNIHPVSNGDAGLATYQDALRGGSPSSWLSTYYSNNGRSFGGNDRSDPIRKGCPPVPEANTSVTFGLMLLLGLIAWRWSTRTAVRRTVRF